MPRFGEERNRSDTNLLVFSTLSLSISRRRKGGRESLKLLRPRTKRNKWPWIKPLIRYWPVPFNRLYIDTSYYRAEVTAREVLRVCRFITIRSNVRFELIIIFFFSFCQIYPRRQWQSLKSCRLSSGREEKKRNLSFQELKLLLRRVEALRPLSKVSNLYPPKALLTSDY